MKSTDRKSTDRNTTSVGITGLLGSLSLYRGALSGCAIATILLVALYQFYLCGFFTPLGRIDAVRLSDVLLLTAGGLMHWVVFALVPVSAFGMLLTTKHDEDTNRIVRRKTYLGIWLNTALKTFGLSLFLASIITVSSLLIGMIWTDGLIDFESKHSLFAFMTEGKTVANQAFVVVVANFFTCCLLVLFLANSLWVFVSLICRKKWIPMLCLFALAFLNELKILFVFDQGIQTLAWINVDYQFWLSGRQYLFPVAGVVLLLVQTVNLILTKRKDYLHP